MVPADEFMIQRHDVRAHVAREYAGVFDGPMIDSFVEAYVGLGLAEAQADQVLRAAPLARRILDVGSGYGSFVLACRGRGLDAVGVEPQPYELHYSRSRIEQSRAHDAPRQTYVSGDGRALPFGDASFDVVTLWNVAEHVKELQQLVDEVGRVLLPGGVLLLLCPNYASVRREAHYHVPWVPMPRRVASWYLTRLGRAPWFFEQHIHYRTPWEVMRALRRAGLRPGVVRSTSLDKLREPDTIERAALRRAVRGALRLHLDRVLEGLVRGLQHNPLRRTIDIVAVKT